MLPGECGDLVFELHHDGLFVPLPQRHVSPFFPPVRTDIGGEIGFEELVAGQGHYLEEIVFPGVHGAAANEGDVTAQGAVFPRANMAQIYSEAHAGPGRVRVLTFETPIVPRLLTLLREELTEVRVHFLSADAQIASTTAIGKNNHASATSTTALGKIMSLRPPLEMTLSDNVEFFQTMSNFFRIFFSEMDVREATRPIF